MFQYSRVEVTEKSLVNKYLRHNYIYKHMGVLYIAEPKVSSLESEV